MKRIYIYALLEPDIDTIRYIGSTVNPKNRLSAHINTPESTDRYKWIQSLLKDGKRPRMIIIEEVELADVRERENYWIDYHKSDKLLNKIASSYNLNVKESANLVVTMRFNETMLNKIKNIATLRNLNYQSMVKQWLAERLEEEEVTE